jgi:hypothetical protein
MSSPIQTAKDKDRDSLLMYAPSWAREKPPVVAAHEPRRAQSVPQTDKLYMENTLLRVAGALFCHDALRHS